MLLVMRSDLVALAAARSWAETLRAGFDELGAPAGAQALLVGEGRPYRGRDVAKVSVAAGGGGAGVAGGGGRGLLEELPRRAASMAGLCRGAAGRPGRDRVHNRGGCRPSSPRLRTRRS